MDKNQLKAYIAGRAARELNDGDFVNLGIGIPTLVADYVPEDTHVVLEAEIGTVGAGGRPAPENEDSRYIIDAGGAPSSVGPGAAFISSALSFALIRGGHVDATILGALQVDAEGSLANWIIPGKLLPGMGGAMDLVVGAKRVIVAMEHTKNGAPKIMKKCTLPYTAQGCVDLIITEMAVIEVTPDGLVLTEYNPEFSVEQIQAATEAELAISPDLKPMS